MATRRVAPQAVTTEQLAAATGRDGRPGWIAVMGTVYDVTGFHRRHPGGRQVTDVLGSDATAAFLSQHGPGFLARQESYLRRHVVGPLAADPPQPRAAPPPPGQSLSERDKIDLLEFCRRH